jgi:hypothetical protein
LDGEGEVRRVVPLLRAEGGEEEPQVCLVATEDGRAAEVEAMYMLFIGTCRKTVWAGGGWGGRASKRDYDERVELEKADLFSYLQKAQEEARRADERLVTSDDERLVTSDDERMLPPLVAMSQKSTGLQFFVLLPDVSSSQMSS